MVALPKSLGTDCNGKRLLMLEENVGSGTKRKTLGLPCFLMQYVGLFPGGLVPGLPMDPAGSGILDGPLQRENNSANLPWKSCFLTVVVLCWQLLLWTAGGMKWQPCLLIFLWFLTKINWC